MAKREDRQDRPRWLDGTGGPDGGRTNGAQYNALMGTFTRLTDVSPRDAAIVGAAILDVMLAELLTARLCGTGKAIAGFVGDGDGSGIASAFSARIQTAYVTGIISNKERRLFDSIRSVRNVFAHQVDAKDVATSGELQGALDRLRTALDAFAPVTGSVPDDVAEKARQEVAALRERCRVNPDDVAALIRQAVIMAALVCVHASECMEPIEPRATVEPETPPA